MRATSEASWHAASAVAEALWRQIGPESAVLGGQLLSVADLVRSNGRLRRALTDPAAPPQAKVALSVGALGASVDSRVVELVAWLAQSRWSQEQDLAETLDRIGQEAVLAGAEAEGALETVEEDLFRVQRFLVAERDVREALSNRSTPESSRQALIDQLFGPTVHPRTLQLLERVAHGSSTSGSVSVVTALSEAAAERRARTVAMVVAGSPLTVEQEDRLRNGLTRAYGRQVQLNVTVDPAVLGGMRVQIGPDVIDGTVLGRVTDARRRLAG